MADKTMGTVVKVPMSTFEDVGGSFLRSNCPALESKRKAGLRNVK